MAESAFNGTGFSASPGGSSEADAFADLGKVEAIDRLLRDSGYSVDGHAAFEPKDGGTVFQASRFFQEGLDFDLTYFPLKHLGYKCVVAVTGELFAAMARPRVLSVRLGISAKFAFGHIQELWSGIVTAAREYGYVPPALDLVPCVNGLFIGLSAVGEELPLTRRRTPKPRSMDLLCVSGSLGAAFMGLQVLEREKTKFVTAAPSSSTGSDRADKFSGGPSSRPDAPSPRSGASSFHPDLEKYKMLVGSYLKPELSAGIIDRLEDAEIYPSLGILVSNGLSDAVKRLARASGLGAKIYADKIPFEGNTFALGKELDIDPVSAAMNGGDDFRLLFAVPILQAEKFRRDFQTFDVIGHLAQADVGSVLVTPDGAELPLRAQGWSDPE